MIEGWEHREGETPYDDLDGFKLIKDYPNPTRQLVDELEEDNIRKATLKYLAQKPSKKLAPFDYYWLLDLHRDMYDDVWEWAGSTRTQNTQIGLDKYQIGEALRMLAADIQQWPEHFDFVEVAARIHYRAVQIHPFKNGNGRWSRLLSNIWLKQNGYPLTIWPSIVGKSPIRDDYLKAVREADNLNFVPLLDLHKRYADNG